MLKVFSKFPESAVPFKVTIYRTVATFRATGSVLHKTESQKGHVLTEETLLNIRARLETSSKMSLRLFIFQCGISSTLLFGTKLLQLRPHKTTVVHSLLPRGCEARFRFCACFRRSLFNAVLDPELTFCSDEVWFMLGWYVKSQER